MTEYLIDLASYQEGIDLAKVKAAGFSKVNVKLSQGNWYQWSRAGEYINRAKELGLGICTFHWLDNSSSGAEQARIVLGLMRRYGVIDGAAHQCDCEDGSRPATWAIWRDYVNAMQDGLGRPIVNYTGDWWWPSHMGNRGAEVTPYLWAAPNNGYLSAYAGDEASHWRAGYGGWGDYALLQYAVQPIAGAGGGDLSKTAIRDAAVWSALTGGDDMDWSDPLTGGDPQVTYPARDWITGTSMGMWNILVPGMRQVAADVAAVKAADTAQTAAITALTAALNKALAGTGGGIDAAPILAAIADVKTTVHAEVRAQFDRLAAAAQAQADALGKS